MRFAVRLTPRGGRDAIDGVVDGALRARVAAAPADGAANETLLRLIARELGVPRATVSLIAGATGRRKLVAVDGLEPGSLLARWPDLGVS
ncbi:MAG: DUF167 family protein [Candidatus Limnocylindrales bacterium]